MIRYTVVLLYWSLDYHWELYSQFVILCLKALMYIRVVDDLMSWMDDVESQLMSEDHGKDLYSVNKLLKKHQVFKLNDYIKYMYISFIKNKYFDDFFQSAWFRIIKFVEFCLAPGTRHWQSQRKSSRCSRCCPCVQGIQTFYEQRTSG